MREIMQLLNVIANDVKEVKASVKANIQLSKNYLNEIWIDNQDVMQMLHISQRTLQTLRSNGSIPYSKIKGKFYYKVADIEQLLQRNYYNPNFKCDGSN